MIIYKTPYRIPLAGGGTDIDLYYKKRGGKLISFTFDQYIYTFLSQRPLDEKILVQTTKSEFSENLTEVKHNTIKEVLRYFKITKKIQIGTFSTIPTKSGLGTSSSQMVGFINNFLKHYHTIEDVCIIGLLPSYETNGESSLIYMINELIKISKNEYSGFYNNNFQELDKLNIRCRLPEGVIPQAGALLVNQSNVSMLTKANYSHYQMLQEVEATFKKWSPAVFLGYSNINFDDEMLRKEFFKGLRQPYLTNTNGNKRQDGLNIVRAAFAVNNKIMKTEINEKGNAVMKLESLARINGFEAAGAHSALFDAELTVKVLALIGQVLPDKIKDT